jgi:hypothetical protein
VLAHRESIIAALQQERDSLFTRRAASEIGQIKSAQRSSAELSRTTGGEPRPIARRVTHTIAGETKKIVKVAAAGCVTGEQQVQLEPARTRISIQVCRHGRMPLQRWERARNLLSKD